MLVDTKGARAMTPRQLQEKFPNTSFPAELNNEALNGFDAAIADEAAKPAHDVTHELAPKVSQRGGKWVVDWDVRVRGNAADAARAKRDRLLAETDHHALQDVEMTQAMREYRQALRDLPQQPGFPGNITWPEKP